MLQIAHSDLLLAKNALVVKLFRSLSSSLFIIGEEGKPFKTRSLAYPIYGKEHPRGN